MRQRSIDQGEDDCGAISCLRAMEWKEELTSSQLQEMGCANVVSVLPCNMERSVNHRKGDELGCRVTEITQGT